MYAFNERFLIYIYSLVWHPHEFKEIIVSTDAHQFDNFPIIRKQTTHGKF